MALGKVRASVRVNAKDWVMVIVYCVKDPVGLVLQSIIEAELHVTTILRRRSTKIPKDQSMIGELNLRFTDWWTESLTY